MRDKNKLALSGIFGKTIFRIPDYQRGYAWQTTQLNDFWEDLINLDIRNMNFNNVTNYANMFYNVKNDCEIIANSDGKVWLNEKFSNLTNVITT